MTELSKEEKFIRHAPCENCGSRDNLAIYSGHTYCFGCHIYQKTNGQLPDHIPIKKEIKGMISGITEALPKMKPFELHKKGRMSRMTSGITSADRSDFFVELS